MAAFQKNTLPSTAVFNRPKKYRVVSPLGRGACGETVHLHDEEMDVDFVAKKFSPYLEKNEDPGEYIELYDRFKKEARILFKLYHPNIVRVFNFYDYEESETAFILMEYVPGYNIIDYSIQKPDELHNIFEKIIAAFGYLEANSILHRDIRPENILITQDGQPKVIDFGFGKSAPSEEEFEKSVSLNLWCEPPNEFYEGIYNFRTEIYFVGKIFERAIQRSGAAEFSYREILKNMCVQEPSNRAESFSAIQAQLQGEKFDYFSFSDHEKETYRSFAGHLERIVAKIYSSTRYETSPDSIIQGLKSVLRNNALEEYLNDNASLIDCFLNGGYKFYSNRSLSIGLLKEFTLFFQNSSAEAQSIILANMHGRLNQISRIQFSDLDDDIPF